MKQKPYSALFGAVATGLILIAAILQMAAVLTAYDPEANYFLPGSPLPAIAIILAILGSLFGIVASILYRESNPSATLFSDKALPALPLLIGSLCGALLFLLAEGALAFLASVLLAATALYAFLSESRFRTVAPATVALLGFAPVLACAILTAHYYFDTSVEMNAPFKVLLQTALLFSMLYFTGELRFLLDCRHPRLHLALCVCTLAASACCSFALLPAFVTGITDRTDYLAGALAVLGIGITLILRALHLLTPAKIDSEPLPESNEETDAVQEEERPE